MSAKATHRSRPHDVREDQLLAGISPDARREIVAGSRRLTLRPGQILFRTGEPAQQLFLLRKGRVQFARLARTGRGILDGDFPARRSLWSRHDPATAESNTSGPPNRSSPARSWSGHVETIQALADEHPQLAGNLLRVALRYVDVFAERHRRLVTVTAEQRLARALTRLGVRTGTRKQAGVEVRIKNEQLASLADVSPFPVSRLLKRWERDGVITKSRGIIHIIWPEKLLFD